ncbi:uncharacterized protein LOC144571969 [Carex rostrata]
MAIDPRMKKYYKPTSRSSETESSSQKKACVELSPSDINADPGLRKPIDEYDKEIRDQVRRAYLLNGPTQPIGHTFSRKQGDHFRSFQESWFKKFDWLEHSVENDSAYFFYRYLFKQLVTSDKFGYEIFTRHVFNNWRKALDAFKEHMTSPLTQKEMVKACAQETSLVILEELGDKLFSVLINESRDTSIKEQMAMTGHVIETFLSIEHVSDTTTSSLKVAIEGLFARHGLSISRL